MIDFAEDEKQLEKRIAERESSIKWLEELQTFLSTKELTETEQIEASSIPDLIQRYSDGKVLAEKLLDAIAYYKRGAANVRRERNAVWLEIAQLKAEENDLRAQLQAIGDELPHKGRDYQIESINDECYETDFHPGTLTILVETKDFVAPKKRRRSFARKVVDSGKKVIDTVRSRSNSRSRTHL